MANSNGVIPIVSTLDVEIESNVKIDNWFVNRYSTIDKANKASKQIATQSYNGYKGYNQ